MTKKHEKYKSDMHTVSGKPIVDPKNVSDKRYKSNITKYKYTTYTNDESIGWK